MVGFDNINPTLSTLLDSLIIPSGFSKYDDLSPEKPSLDAWLKEAPQILSEVKELLHQSEEIMDIELVELGNFVSRVAPFVYDPASLNEADTRIVYEEERNVLRNESPWITRDSRQLSKEILDGLDAQRSERLVKHVLESVVRPIFRASNPHPHINPSTGRSLPESRISRPPQQGGFASVTQDFFESEGQRWKTSPGLSSVLYWCIDNTSSSMYDDVWHLVIPPLMTLLDDYNPRYKLWGLFIARRMLQNVPASLLSKTGIHGLLQTSLTKTLAHQESPLAPTILRLSISQSLRLLELTAPEGTKARFDGLCSLLGEGIITTVWTYTFDKPEVVRATLDVMPSIVEMLGIGCARFLQTLIPQLIHPLVQPSKQGLIPGVAPFDLLQLQIQLCSLHVLILLIQVCAPRMHKWRLTILDALVRCWVAMFVDRAGDIPNTASKSSPYHFDPPPRQSDSDDEEEEEERGEPSTRVVAVERVDSQTVKPSNPSSIGENLGCLKTLLQMATYQLVLVCRDLATNEYPVLLKADPSLVSLLPRIGVQSS